MVNALNSGTTENGSMNNLLEYAANNQNMSQPSNLDFSPDDFFYFQPYMFGQYNSSPSSSSSSSSSQTNVEYSSYAHAVASSSSSSSSPSASPSSEPSRNITNIQIRCTPEDIRMVDNPLCDPNDPRFKDIWTDPDSSYLIKQCYRSQTCANSQLSKTLSMLTSEKDGQLQRKQDLEDVYFFDCINIFNVIAAIAFYISFIIYKSVATPTP